MSEVVLWHGPYRYKKRRDGKAIHSEYLGREISSSQTDLSE
jgi:hypothetical protein